MKVIVAVFLFILIVYQAIGQGSNELPRRGICGDDVTRQRILTGNDQLVAIEFPWLALLQLRPLNGGDLVPVCSGSLINQRYVLTAAHCVMRSEIGTRYRYSDNIALIRLKSDVIYSENIKPICLPSNGGQTRLHNTYFLTTAGWGLTLNNSRGTTKQKALASFWDVDRCPSIYLKINFVVHPLAICAQGHNMSAGCIVDGGGPLMAFHHGVWVLHGIMSYGVRVCVTMNWPDVFTNVGEYDQWIMEKMRP
ncbi:CLIP domain-containing serine protease 14D-like [Drosophila rhopaloa]|uniref:Serine protease easter-like n=1 Tax=Drosophila rhopaloa TaxID=1041015 RepID=A0A6P4EGF6_DRORH|nr:CLIP domain-containing serine protease 14D-like [Drosophila rhopaloa]